MNALLKIRNALNADPITGERSTGRFAESRFENPLDKSAVESLRCCERSAAEHPAYPFGLDIGRVSS
jgi:hypothetical protein